MAVVIVTRAQVLRYTAAAWVRPSSRWAHTCPAGPRRARARGGGRPSDLQVQVQMQMQMQVQV